VVQPRSDRLVDPGGWIVPDLRDVMADRSWTEQAACLNEIELFETESENPHKPPRHESATELLRLLYCSDCRVRVRCLREALTPPLIPAFVVAEGTSGNARESIRGERNPPPRVWGTWGGTTERDRILTAGLPLGERIELLETTFPERLRLQTEAWQEAVRRRVATRRHVQPRDRLVAAIVGEPLLPAKRGPKPKRRPRLFTVGGRGGPGRGHRSKVGSHAEAEGISYATAWRRLQAS
jgi:hypothetical protein